jgi:hypothetical protein
MRFQVAVSVRYVAIRNSIGLCRECSRMVGPRNPRYPKHRLPTRGRRRAKNDGRPHAPRPGVTTPVTSSSVWRQDTVGKAMPVACRDREKALPDARWRAGLRRTQGAAQRQLQAWPLHRRDGQNVTLVRQPATRPQAADSAASRAPLRRRRVHRVLLGECDCPKTSRLIYTAVCEQSPRAPVL